MRESILAYHYADRLKAVFLITGSLLESYERSHSREEIIHALFDALEEEVNTAATVLGKTNQRRLEEARHSLHRALYHFNTGEMDKSREQIAGAISSVTTIAEKSIRELGL
jgi:hypothetical protein